MEDETAQILSMKRRHARPLKCAKTTGNGGNAVQVIYGAMLPVHILSDNEEGKPNLFLPQDIYGYSCHFSLCRRAAVPLKLSPRRQILVSINQLCH
jgi:hypothetical protein